MKSHYFAEHLLEDCLLEPGMRAVCIREVQRSLEQSAKRLLEDKIKQYHLEKDFRIMKAHIETPGDGVIIFNGMQNHTADSIKSLEGYKRAWVEEAQSISQRSLDMLRPTLRAEGSQLWFSWNPRNATDPIDAMLRGKSVPPGAIVVRTSYRDNPWFPKVLRDEMEWDRRTDIEKYNHIWMGEYEQHSEARVFKNWRVEDFETPHGGPGSAPVPYFYFGADWGYSIDPSVLVRIYEQHPAGKRKQLYIDQEIYKIGCEIDALPQLFDSMHEGFARGWVIKADSARPETISYMRNHGYGRMEAARKGPNSVLEGIIFLQGYDIIIHPRCIHTIDEFRLYSYKTDPLTDIVTNILEDKKNHVIDSVRYACESLRTGTASTYAANWG